jgi:hypothetical protein
MKGLGTSHKAVLLRVLVFELQSGQSARSIAAQISIVLRLAKGIRDGHPENETVSRVEA